MIRPRHWMVKLLSLISTALGSLTALTRTRARVVAGLFTFHVLLPVLATLLNSTFQVVPPSPASSITTLPLPPPGSPRSACVLLMDQTSPPLGVRAVSGGGDGQMAFDPAQFWSIPSPQISKAPGWIVALAASQSELLAT